MESSFFATNRFCLMLNTGRSDVRFFARKILQTCLGVPPTGSCEMRRILVSPPLGKILNTIEKNEGLSLVDTSFAPRDSPRPLNKELALSPSYTVHGGQYDTKYSPFD